MSAERRNGHLTSGRLLARNTMWNLAGTVAPVAVAVLAVPYLIHRMGTDRFGVLTLAWVVIGYFSLFDFGFGRALTKLVAERLGSGMTEEVPELFWTSLLLMSVLGGIGALVMAGVTPWLTHTALRIPAAIQGEATRAFYVLAGTIPIVIVSTALRGFLEAHQRFGLSNAVRIPLGVLTFAGPLVVFPFSVSLVPVVSVLAAGRVISCVALWAFCARVHPGLTGGIRLRRDLVPLLFRFGGWMTVTNVVGPLMVSMDRFLIGGLVSMSAVAYYATPSEVVNRLLIVPSAIVGVLFPAFSTAFAQDLGRTRLLFTRGLKYTFLALFPCVLIIVVFAREGLTWWVGSDFAQHGAVVLQFLAVGVFFNGLAQIPFALVQGAGRPDMTGKLHLLELPAYALLLWLLVRGYGIEGAAIAWSVRNFGDALALLVMARRFLPGGLSIARKVEEPSLAQDYR